MKQGKAYTLNIKRKREGKTDYRLRKNLLISGKIRIVVRKKLNNVTIQLINFYPQGDKTLVSAHTRELIKFGWKSHKGNLSSAYLVGLLCGIKAKKKGLSSGVPDFGLSRIVGGSGYFAVIKGLKDSGFDVPVGDKVLPSDDRIKGKHIEDYASKLKGKPNYEKQFSLYLKSGFKPEDFTKHFEEVKNKILVK